VKTAVEIDLDELRVLFHHCVGRMLSEWEIVKDFDTTTNG